MQSFFTIDTHENSELKYKGFHDPSHHWNGWAVPVFTKEEAVKIINDFNKGVESYSGDEATESMRFDNDNIVYSDCSGEVETIKPFTIVLNEQDVIVYDLSLGWVWEEYTEQMEG